MGTYLAWVVVWSKPLIAAVVGAELAVVGLVGVTAATPPAATESFYLPPTVPPANESFVLSFAPTAVLGHRELGFYWLVPMNRWCTLPVASKCWATFNVTGCKDPACQSLGAFHTQVRVEGPVGSEAAVPPAVGTFLITLVSGDPQWISIQMMWTSSSGIPVGFAPLGVALGATTVAGLVTASTAWVIGRRRGDRWVKEVPIVG